MMRQIPSFPQSAGQGRRYRGGTTATRRAYGLSGRPLCRNVRDRERPDLRLPSGAAVEQRPERLRAEGLGAGLVQHAAGHLRVLAGPLAGRGGAGEEIQVAAADLLGRPSQSAQPAKTTAPGGSQMTWPPENVTVTGAPVSGSDEVITAPVPSMGGIPRASIAHLEYTRGRRRSPPGAGRVAENG
jgi:hypothetical protein